MKSLSLNSTISNFLFNSTFSSNQVNDYECTRPLGSCKPGLILSVWLPQKNLTTGEIAGRAIVYALSLIFIFGGVNKIADKFIDSIEVITSQKREVKVKDKNGGKKALMVRYWNETVSNLTLMALGTSAPEILLSIIEIFGNNFDSGELGPNVIVGSAAYNLFVIVGYCVLVVPKDEVRKIERLRVFFVTASWMIFAYIWLLLIIVVISPGIVELWEAIVTCLFFPLTIMSAYAVDKKLYLNTSERVESARKLIGVTFKLIEKKVRKEKSTTMRRESNAIRSIIGVSSALQTITFSPSYYVCFESVSELEIYVIRHGGDINRTIMVDYKTEDDSAEADSDYLHEEGTLVFRPNEIKKNININIIEDSIYEGDEKFYVHLLNARYEDGTVDDHLKISNPDKATVIILDDDHGGVFFFEKKKVEVVENVGIFRIKVLRTIGAKGKVKIPYKTVDSTAIGGKDFKKQNDYIIFYNNETEKYIDLEIVEHEEYQSDETFFVELSEPIIDSDKTKLLYNDAGKPRLGEISKIEIKIKEKSIIKNVIDKLLVRNSDSRFNTYLSLWKKQFIDAFKVLSDEDDEEINESKESVDKEPKKPKIIDYFFHIFYFFWKLIFSIVPPSEIWKGYPCFFASLFMIGILTVFIGDLATHFGCTIGLKDSITAIVFVSLGTSTPDTFASKIAAIHDKNADNSIGNITGTNSINVFVGIGIAWLIAAIYHSSKGETFKVKPGSLGFSVTIFCIFAFICVIVLLIRRNKRVGGELGGPMKYRIPTAFIFFFLWILYIVLSALEAYCHIQGF